LTANDLNAHAWMTIPAHGVELDVSSDDWLVQVGVLQVIRVCVTIEHLSSRRQNEQQMWNQVKGHWVKGHRVINLGRVVSGHGSKV